MTVRAGVLEIPQLTPQPITLNYKADQAMREVKIYSLKELCRVRFEGIEYLHMHPCGKYIVVSHVKYETTDQGLRIYKVISLLMVNLESGDCRFLWNITVQRLELRNVFFYKQYLVLLFRNESVKGLGNIKIVNVESGEILKGFKITVPYYSSSTIIPSCQGYYVVIDNQQSIIHIINLNDLSYKELRLKEPVYLDYMYIPYCVGCVNTSKIVLKYKETYSRRVLILDLSRLEVVEVELPYNSIINYGTITLVDRGFLIATSSILEFYDYNGSRIWCLCIEHLKVEDTHPITIPLEDKVVLLREGSFIVIDYTGNIIGWSVIPYSHYYVKQCLYGVVDNFTSWIIKLESTEYSNYGRPDI